MYRLTERFRGLCACQLLHDDMKEILWRLFRKYIEYPVLMIL